ncbi:type II secretion system protein [Thalassotalea litorea]|uniref:type II secretion system protein n=1 Tax=Thalassotalea litorea TaxID=2020715 RepID=UPI003734E3E5
MDKTSAVGHKLRRLKSGFILITTLIFLLILAVTSGGLFNQILSTQQQSNLAINHITQLNDQKSLLNLAKQQAQQLITAGHDLMQMSEGFTPQVTKDDHPLADWFQFHSLGWQPNEKIHYRLIYIGQQTNDNNETVYWFSVEQHHSQWQLSALPTYTISVPHS